MEKNIEFHSLSGYPVLSRWYNVSPQVLISATSPPPKKKKKLSSCVCLFSCNILSWHLGRWDLNVKSHSFCYQLSIPNLQKPRTHPDFHASPPPAPLSLQTSKLTGLYKHALIFLSNLLHESIIVRCIFMHYTKKPQQGIVFTGFD